MLLYDKTNFGTKKTLKTGHVKKGLNWSFDQIEQITENNNSSGSTLASFLNLFLHQHFGT